jgi:hypothetical protein
VVIREGEWEGRTFSPKFLLTCRGLTENKVTK